MTKSKTILAGLGVVAALGVAAMPLASYATQTPQSVSGNVLLAVEVQPAISMTIEGNNDTPTADTYGADLYTELTPASGTSVAGYYLRSGSEGSYEYTLQESGTADGTTKYYQKVVKEVDAFNPAALANLELDGHTSPATSITGTSSSYVSLLPNAKVEGDRSAATPASDNNFGSTITVYTNNNSGYTLSVKDADDDLDLVHTENSQYRISASGSAVEAGQARWNYDVTRHGSINNEDAFVPTETTATNGTKDTSIQHQAITAANVPIDNYTAKTANGRETIVDYNVSTAKDQATGFYTDTIIYTAATNN